MLFSYNDIKNANKIKDNLAEATLLYGIGQIIHT